MHASATTAATERLAAGILTVAGRVYNTRVQAPENSRSAKPVPQRCGYGTRRSRRASLGSDTNASTLRDLREVAIEGRNDAAGPVGPYEIPYRRKHATRFRTTKIPKNWKRETQLSFDSDAAIELARLEADPPWCCGSVSTRSS